VGCLVELRLDGNLATVINAASRQVDAAFAWRLIFAELFQYFTKRSHKDIIYELSYVC